MSAAFNRIARAARLERVHVGQAPYADSRGTIRASYQLLNDKGYAEATVNLVDGAVMGLRSLPGIDLGRFIADAKALYAGAKPVHF
jgi:hypothetical protein